MEKKCIVTELVRFGGGSKLQTTVSPRVGCRSDRYRTHEMQTSFDSTVLVVHCEKRSGARNVPSSLQVAPRYATFTFYNGILTFCIRKALDHRQ